MKKEKRATIEKSPARQGKTLHRVFVWSVLTVVAAALLVLGRHETTKRISSAPPDRATLVRAALPQNTDGRPSQNPIRRLRENIERFMITDINNPAASAVSFSGTRNARQFAGVQSSTNYTYGNTQPRHFTEDPNLVYWVGHNTETYGHFSENSFLMASDNPLSTFSIDVDTASYTNVRRFLRQNIQPPKDAVRIEEMINYFSYDYPLPNEDAPFSVNVEVAPAPWQPSHRLARIGLRGYEIPATERPACNLVFLLDVSGSMSPPNKLPLVKRAMSFLVSQLSEQDHVGIVVYAGAAGEVLPPTSCDRQEQILGALDRLKAGGSTNGGQGIQLAYDMARRYFDPEAVNRVILATDGDFNVGMTNNGDLVRFIEKRAKDGVFLSVLGFGMGNLKDDRLEQLADKGDGNYAYVDTYGEATRVFGEQLAGTLITIAKDVKIQVEFNPAMVQAYRLIGYENRLLAAEDFNDDQKDAGEIGAGHTVTALYEIVPVGVQMDLPSVDSLRYRTPPARFESALESDELMHVKLRYKKPRGLRSQRLAFPVTDERLTLANATPDFRFAAAVAEFGMLLRQSRHAGNATFDDVLDLAQGTIDFDSPSRRSEFLELVRTAKMLSGL